MFRPRIGIQLLWFIAFVVICFAAAGLGSIVTSMSVNGWYQTLRKPAWTPPDWVFGPVWSILYLLMAIAAWLIWRRRGWPGAAKPLSVFFLQLALNVGWSALFFGLRSPSLAFVEICVLWAAVAITLRMFWCISPTAGFLLVPYLMWTSFAAVLNFAIWQLNR